MTVEVGTTIRFVIEAIEGKYHAIDVGQLAQEVEAALLRLSKVTSLDELMEARREVRDAVDDINNQVAALIAISQFSDARPLRENPLTFLHRIVFAAEPSETRRRGARVSDFPDDVPTDVSEASARFEELEAVVGAMALAPVDCFDVAAPLLAHVFAAVVRIHPFEDGNGRVARFAVQFLLMKWGMDLLPLPKVRNDPEWKRALECAIRGDLEALSEQIHMRLERNRGA